MIEGVPGAGDEFVLRFSRYVYAILLRNLRLPGEVADDLYQQVFVRLWEDGFRRLRLWRGEDDFAGYLAPIVRNLAAEHFRRAARRPASGNPEEFEGIARDEPTPEELAAVEEQRRLVEREVEKLDSRSREIYRLRFVENRLHREIAEALGVQVSAVGVALVRLERRLVKNTGVSGRERATVRSGGTGASSG